MKLSSQKYVSFVSIICTFSCLVCVMRFDHDVISMITTCILCKLSFYGPYSVQIRENMDQTKVRTWALFRQ